jgi:hypothetical protein
MNCRHLQWLDMRYEPMAPDGIQAALAAENPTGRMVQYLGQAISSV